MSEKREFIEGEIIHNLVFIREDFYEREVTGRQKYRRALFQCLCGNKVLTQINSVVFGNTKSCGCLQKEKAAFRYRRHGMSNTITYNSWSNMRDRCLNKKAKFYENYGGRGIIVCKKWLDDFKEFYKDMGERPSKEYSLDRIDPNGNYEPLNCRWSTRREQDRNRTTNIHIEHNGEKKILKDWADQFDMVPNTLKKRLKRGLTMEEAAKH